MIKPSGGHRAIKTIISEWIGLLIVVIVYFLLIIRYWLKWGSIIVDFGREVYIPWQLNMGKVLYRDIDYVMGALAPYLNALWWKISGVSITNLFVHNLVMIAILTCFIYKIIVEICDRTTATLSCLMFLFLFTFSSDPTMNFISPYDHNLTTGFFFAVLMILFMFNYQYRPQVIKIVCAGFCLGLVFLTKAEIFLAGVMTAIVGMIINRKVIKFRIHSLQIIIIAFIGSMIFPILLFFVYFTSQMPLDQALRGLLGNWYFIFTTGIIKSPYYQGAITGLDKPIINILFSLTAFTVILVILVGGLIIEFISRGTWKKHKLIIFFWLSLNMIVCSLLLYSKTNGLFRIKELNDIYLIIIGRSLPLVSLLMIAGSILLIVKVKNNDEDKKKAAQLIIWFVFGFLLLGKMMLHSTIKSIGFVLAVPAFLSLVIFSVWLIPKLLTLFYGKCYFYRRIAIIGLIILMVAIFSSNDRVYTHKDLLIGKGADSFFVHAHPGSAESVNQMTKYIETFIPVQANLLVLPEGVMINYLTRHQPPVPLIVFTPCEFVFFGEPYIFNLLTKHPADFILLVHRPMDGFFGTDWGKSEMDWVKEHYSTVMQFGAEPLQGDIFGMKLLKLNPTIFIRGNPN